MTDVLLELPQGLCRATLTRQLPTPAALEFGLRLRVARGAAVSMSRPSTRSEPSELIYFKVYKSQIPVIEQAIETAALMLGSDKSRGYCLEMICADFLAGASMDGGNPEILLQSISRYYKFLPGKQQEVFRSEVNRKAS